MLIHIATRFSRDPSWSNQEVVRDEKFARGGVNWMNLLPFNRKKLLGKFKRRSRCHGCGGCKCHTSNDVFSRCKSVHKMATGKSDDELIQSDNKMRIGTRSEKLITVDGT